MIHVQLAEQGILMRLFTDQARIRFDLPAGEAERQRWLNILSELRLTVVEELTI